MMKRWLIITAAIMLSSCGSKGAFHFAQGGIAPTANIQIVDQRPREMKKEFRPDYSFGDALTLKDPEALWRLGDNQFKPDRLTLLADKLVRHYGMQQPITVNLQAFDVVYLYPSSQRKSQKAARWGGLLGGAVGAAVAYNVMDGGGLQDKVVVTLHGTLNNRPFQVQETVLVNDQEAVFSAYDSEVLRNGINSAIDKAVAAIVQQVSNPNTASRVIHSSR